MPQSERYRINAPQVVAETIGGEAIIVNLDTGAYFSLRDTAAAIWQGLEQGESAVRITEFMAGRYAGAPAEIESAVQELIEALVGEGLIEAIGPDEAVQDIAMAGAHEGASERPAFTRPVMEKFTDMADLLLLDPIHEVDDDLGWPRATVQPGR